MICRARAVYSSAEPHRGVGCAPHRERQQQPAARPYLERCRPRTGIAIATIATVLASLPGCETEPVAVTVTVAVTGNGSGAIEASAVDLVCQVVSGSVDPSPCETRFMDDDGTGRFTLAVRPEGSSGTTLGGTASVGGIVACSGPICTASYDNTRENAEFRFDVGFTLPTPASVQVSPSTTTIDVGEMINVSAEAFGGSGVSLPRTFSWSSSDPSIAGVQPLSSSGSTTVTGIAPGVVTVSAATGSVSDFATITVEQP